ncbi:MAG: hypothetical protein ACI9T9_002617 [Oleiphilaceae bacterium]|jgi:hypothetical protein
MILKIWKDPVWSKVIAAIIFSAFVSVYTYFTGAWGSIFQFGSNIYAFLFESTLVINWLLALLVIFSLFFTAGRLLKLKNKLFGSSDDWDPINKLEEQMLVLMAKNGNEQYQIPFFVRVLEIDKAKAQLYAGHLADMGLIECEMRSSFPLYSMSVDGRNYLVTNRLI